MLGDVLFKAPFVVIISLIIVSLPSNGQKIINDFKIQDSDLEITLWAETPLLYNPTNFDVDANWADLGDGRCKLSQK